MGSALQNIDYSNGSGSGSVSENATGLKRIAQVIGQALYATSNGSINIPRTVGNLLNMFANGDLDDLPGVVMEIVNAVSGKEFDLEKLIGLSVGQVKTAKQTKEEIASQGKLPKNSAKSTGIKENELKELKSAIDSGDRKRIENLVKTYNLIALGPAGNLINLLGDIATARRNTYKQSLINSKSSFNNGFSTSKGYRDTKKK